MRKNTTEIDAAAKAARPPKLTKAIFSDVYESVPDHIRKQGEFLFDLQAPRQGRGDEFPVATRRLRATADRRVPRLVSDEDGSDGDTAGSHASPPWPTSP